MHNYRKMPGEGSISMLNYAHCPFSLIESFKKILIERFQN